MARFRPDPEESPALVPPPRLPPTAVGLATMPPAIPPGGRAISRITFYRCALVVGLLVPTLLWLAPGIGEIASEWDVLGFIVDVVPIAGPPFVIVALAAWGWVGRARRDQLTRVVWLLPPLFALVLLVWCTARSVISNAGLESGILASVWALTVSLLTLGYAYLALVELCRTRGERRGWLRASAAA